MFDKKINEGDLLPKFNLMSTSGKEVTNNDTVGKKNLLFIYPKDNTTSCTKEANDFSELNQEFSSLGTKIFGISKDSISSHNKFISKHNLQIELLSDESAALIESLGCWVEKSMYGKKYMGIERTSIFVSEDGKILKIWRKVRVPGHAQEVLKFLKNIK